VKEAILACVYYARVCSCNQPVLCNELEVSCSRKQRGPLMRAQTQDCISS